ncbi:NB-ARC domain-containing protein [Accumulibacter sp.]|uniref:NB-ARC domain-containing protein n=1 Tax=Accumulibacter sp. TaxID=2053492 RepID=UPI0025F35DDA|nr:NB-ARC domain-containing protein [Accumulibacter sp.]MCM8595659.1 NB-ARC domain-containing protein [Accumulibacter sp.]MCM8625997.1 NB-ARC domain-containing protein [Accumulibacter sp.]MDS4049806.1 NB-ARC domain-containing protein [Accumulibacter sp.]
MSRIFLSYARDDDEPFVQRLYADFVAEGFDVWFDRVSMPSRGLTFHQEIRDAVAACHRLVLVVGPMAVASDYVTQEWQFAYLAAGRTVNPIVRLDGRSPSGEAIDGYALIPEDLRLLHAEDFRRDEQYAQALAGLVRQLREPPAIVGKLVAVPELPPGYRAQPERLRAVRDMLLLDLRTPVVVTGAAARVGLQGMGGIGKSVLANAVAHHPEVQRAFADNLYWIRLGQQAQVEDLQRWLARELGDRGEFTGRLAGRELLRRLLAERAVLLILDDVWQREDAEDFNVIGPRGRILLTTRDAGLVTALASREHHYQVALPTPPQARELLAAAADAGPETLPPEADEILRLTGRLPLALALCGGMARAGVPWRHVAEALREHDLEFLSDEHPGEDQHRNAWVAMDVSVRALREYERKRFAELAVFAAGASVPEAAVATLWQHTAGYRERDSARLLRTLIERSLLQRPADGAGLHITLHDLLQGFAQGMAEKQHGSREALHELLVQAYRGKCEAGDFANGPDDGYYLQHLVRHLLAAGRLDDAVELLDGLRWIDARRLAGQAFWLIQDYAEVIGALPEARADIEEEARALARLVHWGEAMTAYARQWSRRRDYQAVHGCWPDDREPVLPEPPPSARMWTDEEIDAECRRMIGQPTRLDRLRQFEGFVRGEVYPLDQFGKMEGFAAQHAVGTYPEGPVHDAAMAALAASQAPALVRRWPPGSKANPKPALLATLRGHDDKVSSVAITADGRRAVSGSEDNTVRVWDLDTGQCLRTLNAADHFVGSVAVTPDGRRAVSSSDDNTLCVWDLDTGQSLRTLAGHKAWVVDEGIAYTGVWLSVWRVALTPDGRRAVSGGYDKTLLVWDLDAGECLRTLRGHRSSVANVALTPDGRRAVSGSRDNTLRVWDLDTSECLRTTLHGHYGIGSPSVAVTPDARRAVSGGGDMTLRVWDLDSGQCLRTLNAADHFVRSVAVTADGRRAVSGGADKTLRVWDLDSGQCLRTLNAADHWVSSVAVSPDGRRAVSGSEDNTVRVWDLDTGQCLRTLHGHDDWVHSVALTPDGRRALAISDICTLRVWDLDSGQWLRTLHGHESPVTSVALTPDGRRAVSGSRDNTLRVWDLDTGQCLRTLNAADHRVSSVAVTPDGRRAISGGDDSTLRVWDLDTGQCLRTLNGHDDCVYSVALTPDGRRAVSGCYKTLGVWDLDSGQCVRTLHGHDALVAFESVALTPDGRRAVSGSRDNTLRVWDLDTGQCLRTLNAADHRVSSVAVTPDGRRAISGGDDSTLRVWDLDSGQCLGGYLCGSAVKAAATGMHGNRILAVTDLGEVVILVAENIPAGPSIVTAPRAGASRCPDCGSEFEPDRAIRSAIESLTASLTPDQSPCLSLPDAAFADPRLSRHCPHCDSPLQFNPFFSDNPSNCR